MNQGGTRGGGMNWVFAGAVSLALHAVVLALFAWSGREHEQVEEGKVEGEKKVEVEGEMEKVKGEEVKVKGEKVKGEKVKVKGEEVTVKGDVEKVKTREPERQVAVETYVVRKGDMLTHIAQDRNCTIQDLAKLNGTTAKRLANLRVGQKIKVPRKAD